MVSLGNLEWSNLGIESFDEAADVSLASMGVGGNGGGVGPPFVGVVVTVTRLMLEEGALVD